MKIIKMPRGTGKTLKLIKLSHKNNIPIMVLNNNRKREIDFMARDFKISCEVMTIEEAKRKHPRKIYVDDLDDIIRMSFYSEIVAATVTGSNPLQVLKHRLWVLFRKRS